MPLVTLRELVEGGMHFGHRASRWNPKMEPYIFGKRNLIHIIDLRETIRGLVRAAKCVEVVCREGGDVLFVGTKRQARNTAKNEATRCKMHYVSERWIGGTLTNFETIRSRLRRLNELEELERTGEMSQYSKKMASSLRRERRKIERNLQGIRNMQRLPRAVVIVDPRREKIAVAEAKRLGIPTICLADTDADPDWADILIPGNDDAMRSVGIVFRKLADAAIAGRKQRVSVSQAGPTSAKRPPVAKEKEAGAPTGTKEPVAVPSVSSDEKPKKPQAASPPSSEAADSSARTFGEGIRDSSDGAGKEDGNSVE